MDKAKQSQASASPFPVLLLVVAPGSKPHGAVTRSLPVAWPGSDQSPAWAPQGPGQQQAALCPREFIGDPLIIRGDIDVFPVGLLRGNAPPVDVVRALLLLLRLWSFLLQLLPFVLCPPVLEPHLHLAREGGGTGEKHPRGPRAARRAQHLG